MKSILLVLSCLLAASLSFAETTLHTISLKNGGSFNIISGNTLAIYPLSERMKPVIQESRKRSIIAADYNSGTTITTARPRVAAQEILRQISEQTGRPLGVFQNSALVAAEPSVILMAADETSVWHVILTPKSAENYVLTVSYLIDQQKKQ